MVLDKIRDFNEQNFYGQELNFEDPTALDSTFTGPQLSPEDLAGPIFPTQPEHLPRYNELTMWEKGAMDALPGIQDNAAFGALEKFSNWGPVKWFFDAADALSGHAEQSIGTAYLMRYDPDLQEFGLGKEYGLIGSLFDTVQAAALGAGAANWIDDPETQAKFLSAWDAAASFYETTALPDAGVLGVISKAWTDPRSTGVPEGEGGFVKNVFGAISGLFIDREGEEELEAEIDAALQVQWDHLKNVFEGKAVDVGGLPQLVAMRQQMYLGNDPEQVRQDYFENLGALAFRSQVWNAVGFAAIDPLFFILPKLAPGEALRYFKTQRRTSKVAPQITDAVNQVGDIVKTVEGIGDARLAVDVPAETATAFDNLRVVAKELDMAEFTNRITDAEKAINAGGDVGTSLEPVREFLKQFDDLEDMGNFERYLFKVTGGDPFNPPKLLEKIGSSKLGAPVGWFVKALTMTPRSRATEFTESMMTSLRLIMKNSDDPLEWIENIERGAMGLFGKDLGHAFVSPVGRHVQAVAKGWVAKGSDLAISWKGMQNERVLAESVARLLGTDMVEMIVRLQAGGLDEAETIIRQLSDVAQSGQVTNTLLDAVVAGQFRADNLFAIAELFKSTTNNIMPFTPDSFRAALMVELVEVSHDMAVAQFGPKAEGVLKKMTSTMKAVESLVLLGLNPNYPIQNFFNNEITGIARGLTNTLSSGDIARVWDDFGMRSGRLGEAFTIAGEAAPSLKKLGLSEGALKGALNLNEELLQAIERGETGVFDKLTSMISNKKLAGMRVFASAGERWQGNRFLTQGLIKAWDNIKPHVFSHFDEVSGGLGARLDDFGGSGYSGVLRDQVLSARKVEDLDAIQHANRLQMNLETIARTAADNMGMDTEKINFFIGDELRGSVDNMIRDLGDNPSVTDIQVGFAEISRKLQSHLDASLAEHIPVMIDEFAEKVKLTGPNGVIDIHGQIFDDIFTRQADHAKMLDEGWARIGETKNPFLREKLIDSMFLEQGRAWARTWDYAEAATRGIEKGLAGKFDLGDDFVGGMVGIRRSSENFIALRNSENAKFFEKVRAKAFKTDIERNLAFEKMQDTLDIGYEKLITDQNAIWERMDEAFLGMFQEDNVVPLAAAWRSGLRDMRAGDMRNLAEFRQSIRGLNRAEISAAWQDFNVGRLEVQQQIQKMEQAGRSMLAGDPDAIAYFTQLSGQKQMVLTREAAQVQGQVMDVLGADEFLEFLSETEPGLFDFEKVVQKFGTNWNDYPEEIKQVIGIKAGDMIGEAGLGDRPTKRVLFEAEFGSGFEGGLKRGKGPEWWQDIKKGKVKIDGETFSGQHAVAEVLKRISVGDFRKQPMFDRVLDTVLGELKTKNISQEAMAFALDIGDEQLRASRLAAGLAEDGGQIAKQGASLSGDPTLPDADALIDRQIYHSTGIDELWFKEGSSIVTEMEQVAIKSLDDPAMSFADMPADLRNDLANYLDIARGELNDGRHVAVRMAEGFRDSAMLNYRRQYGFDAALGYFAPFGFWTTHSIARWAIHSLDHPAMLGTWAKSTRIMEGWIGDRKNLPRRLQGRIKIGLPFVPKEFGEVWVDPLRAFGLPFQQLSQPLENLYEQTATVEGRMDNKLQEWLSTGRITDAQYQQAIANPDSELMNRAKNAVLTDDEDLTTSPLDFMNMAYSSHLPYQYLKAVAEGKTEELAPTPGPRTLKTIAGLLGIDPGYYDNTWGNVRRAAGLPGFDKWEDYRIDRELSNMVAEGIITVEEMNRTMIEREGQVFEEAWRRTNKAQGLSTFWRMAGLPIQPYPEGEEKLRELYDEFEAAMKLRDNTGSPEPLTAFFNENPEFEARLALWDEPEERVNKFLVDQIWSAYSDLEGVDRRLAREQLGEDFVRGFLDKDTADPKALDPELLGAWLKQLGGETVGGLGETAVPLEFAPPDVRNMAARFYDVRNLYYPDFFKLQSDYFDLAEGKPRRDFRNANPQLGKYWEWRRKFFRDNPNVVPYLSDNFEPNYASPQAQQEAFATQPNFGQQEATVAMLNVGGSALLEMGSNYSVTGELSEIGREAFALVAESMGISLRELLNILRGSAVLQ